MQYGNVIGFLAIDDPYQKIIPWAASSTNTWVNQPLCPCQRLGCMQGSCVLLWAITGTNLTGGIFLRLCGEVLSDSEA